MKVLSLRQPWAWFVINGGKRIENRRWNTRFRGDFLIHAAKGMTRAEYEDARYMLEDVCGIASPIPDQLPSHETIQRGGIVGAARLIDVVRPRHERCDCAGGCESHYPPGVEWRWHMREQFGFIIDRVASLPFTPLSGSLGFFDYAPCAQIQGPIEQWREAPALPGVAC